MEQKKEKVDPELFGLQLDLSAKLFEIPVWMAKKVIAVTNLEIERAQKFQKRGDEIFAVALNFMQEKRFDLAVEELGKAKAIRNDGGDKTKAILTQAYLSEALGRMWFKGNFFSPAFETSKEALKCFKSIGNEKDVIRIKALIQDIEEQEDLARDLVERTIRNEMR